MKPRGSRTALSGAYLVAPGPKLPLVASHSLDGDAGFGKSAPSVLPTEMGVLVSQRGRIALFTLDLGRELWRVEGEGWCDVGIRCGAKVIAGPFNGSIQEFEIVDGTAGRRCPIDDETVALVGTHEDWLLVRRPGVGLQSIDWRGEVRWVRPPNGVSEAISEGLLVQAEDLDRRLVCIDLASGAVRWSWIVPPGVSARTARVRFGGCVVVERQVLVRTLDDRLFVLDVATGQVVAEGTAPQPGAVLVSETNSFFKQPFGLVEFDHREMREVGRAEYRSEVEPLYAGNAPTVNAFCLTEESVVWTTMHGVLMGVSRRPGPAGKRVTWSYEVPGAIMPIAEPPVAWGDYLYFTKKSENPELLCFKSAAAAD